MFALKEPPDTLNNASLNNNDEAILSSNYLVSNEEHNAYSFKDQNLLVSYFKDIYDTKLLSKEEEEALGEKILAGDEDAKQELTTANLRLVVSIAKKAGAPDEMKKFYDITANLVSDGKGIQKLIDSPKYETLLSLIY